MDSSHQIDIPPSFTALFHDRAGRLRMPFEVVLLRYELCEDLACALSEQAQHLYHSGHSSEEAVLLALHQGISTPDSGLAAPEAAWVVQRIAELLGWRAPSLPQVPPGQ